MAGPAVCLILTPNSLAMTNAIVVLPSPGGPKSNTWSKTSSRIFAALIKISNCSLTLS